MNFDVTYWIVALVMILCLIALIVGLLTINPKDDEDE